MCAIPSLCVWQCLQIFLFLIYFCLFTLISTTFLPCADFIRTRCLPCHMRLSAACVSTLVKICLGLINIRWHRVESNQKRVWGRIREKETNRWFIDRVLYQFFFFSNWNVLFLDIFSSYQFMKKEILFTQLDFMSTHFVLCISFILSFILIYFLLFIFISWSAQPASDSQKSADCKTLESSNESSWEWNSNPGNEKIKW